MIEWPQWASRRLLVTLLLGFASGLPLALVGGTLQAWFASEGVDIRAIGIASLVGLPYALKFLWSPLMDRFVPPWLGRRRGWLLLTQLLLIGLILLMSTLVPQQHLHLMLWLALLLAFVSASQDIAIDAYRTDLLETRERGFGAALSVAGYRLALLSAGAGALILADRIGWEATYRFLALLMLVGLVASIMGPRPAHEAPAPATLRAAVVEPFADFLQRHAALGILLFIVLYKFGDAFAGTLTTAFLIQDLQFSMTDVGMVSKGFGLLATLVGALFGGVLMYRLRLFRALLIFGVLQALTNLGFVGLAQMGSDHALVYEAMVAAVAMENMAGGMGTAAFVALLMALCNHRYTATQFALLSALAAVARIVVGPPAGELVHYLGWAPFFAFTFVMALPGLWLLLRLRAVIEEADRAQYSHKPA